VKKKPIIHLRWRKTGDIPAYAKAYYAKYAKRRSMCWLAPDTKKVMTGKISDVTCKRCLATFKRLRLGGKR